MNIILTIAGSDSGGGAGIQADLKTFEALGAFGLTALTAVTAQNSQHVSGIRPIPPDFLELQLKALGEDFNIAAVKMGMLHNRKNVQVVAQWLEDFDGPVVLDPVMIATSGDSLSEEAFAEELLATLAPHITVITPNIPEICTLLGIGSESQSAATLPDLALKLYNQIEPSAVLLKGAHLFTENKNGTQAIDYLIEQGVLHSIEGPLHPAGPLHGTGCTLSAALAVYLAEGLELLEATQKAKHYVSEAIRLRPEGIGKGAAPLRHRFDLIEE